MVRIRGGSGAVPGRGGDAPRFEPGESQEQLPCQRETSASLGMCHRIRFVFSSYSLGVLPSFPYGGQEAIRASPDTCLFVQPLTRFRHLFEPTRRRPCRSPRIPAATKRVACSAVPRKPRDCSQPAAQTASTALQIPAPHPKSPSPTKCTPHRLAFRPV